MITFLSLLLCECSGFSVPAGTFRICVYSPVFGSPDNTANCMPFLSGSSVHFRSVNDTINGVPSDFVAAADVSTLSSPTAAEKLSATIIKTSLLI